MDKYLLDEMLKAMLWSMIIIAILTVPFVFASVDGALPLFLVGIIGGPLVLFEAWYGERHDIPWQYVRRQNALRKALEENDIPCIYRLVSDKYSLWISENVMDWYENENRLKDVKALWKFLHDNDKDPLPEDALDAWIRLREDGYRLYRYGDDGSTENPGAHVLSVPRKSIRKTDAEYFQSYASDDDYVDIPFEEISALCTKIIGKD